MGSSISFASSYTVVRETESVKSDSEPANDKLGDNKKVDEPQTDNKEEKDDMELETPEQDMEVDKSELKIMDDLKKTTPISISKSPKPGSENKTILN